jgi:acid phosphatase type 7
MTAATATPSSTRTTRILQFTPVADTYVDSQNPNRNYGSSNTLWLGARPPQEAYIRFEVNGLSGTVTSATLRVYATTGSNSGGSVRRMTSTNWSESSVTYNTRPIVDGPILSTLRSVQKGRWHEFDISGTTIGNGALSLALVSGSNNAVAYAAREDSVYAPRLVISVVD